MGEPIKVLHVDDDHDFTVLFKDRLEHESDAIEVISLTTPWAALDYLESEDVDCVVCDYKMPAMDGLELLRSVREVYEDIPFIMYTGKGSEDVASEAITTGATDYLQKKPAEDQFSVLARRITNACERVRSSRKLHEQKHLFETILEDLTEAVFITDEAGEFTYVSPSVSYVFGYSPAEIEAMGSVDALFESEPIDEDGLTRTGELSNVETTITNESGEQRTVLVSAKIVAIKEGTRLYSIRDVTEHKENELALARKSQRLEKFASLVSHDLRNLVNVATMRLDLVERDCDSEHIEDVDHVHHRMAGLIDNLLILARGGESELATAVVSLPDVVDSCWKTVKRPIVTLEADVHGEIHADRDYLERLFENLFQNSIDHGEGEVTVTVGSTAEGFFVEDDGPGIPEDEREDIFEFGYTTAPDGHGIGLNIVSEIVDGHGWDVTATEGEAGGARFEITGVTWE